MSVQSAQPVPSVPPVAAVEPARPVRRLTLAAAVATAVLSGALLAPAAHAAPGEGKLTSVTAPATATAEATATTPPANAPSEDGGSHGQLARTGSDDAGVFAGLAALFAAAGVLVMASVARRGRNSA